MTETKYFENRQSAVRYATARPDIHGTALSKFVALSRIEIPVSKALDVGCGTGQSALALADLAVDVVAMDPSESMLAQCKSRPNIEYKLAAAEDIPANEETFDLITVAQAFHWLNQDAFLAEAQRVLRDGGWLVIYGAWFTAEMKENSDFAKWFKERYLSRFPTPPRNKTPINDAWAREYGFSVRGEEGFSVEAPMTVDRFTDYELSTTNVIAAVEEQRGMFKEAEKWIADSIEPFFDGEKERTFLFSGKSSYLQKAE